MRWELCSFQRKVWNLRVFLEVQDMQGPSRDVSVECYISGLEGISLQLRLGLEHSG